MTAILTGQHNIQDLIREVIIDDGSGQPAVLTTTTAPVTASLSVGAFESVLNLDLVTNSTENTFVWQVVQDWTVVTQENVATVVGQIAESGSFGDAVTTSEAVTTDGVPNPNVSTAVATSEAVTIAEV